MVTRWRGLAALAVLLTLALTGCTSATLRITTSDRPEPSGMEALLSATLALDDDGCVYADANGDRISLVWPKGYIVRGDSASFEVVDAEGNVVARSGTALAIGGGGVDSTGDTWSEGGCATGQLWLVGEVSTA